MSNVKPYILFAETNPYQANRDTFFRGRTRIAVAVDYATPDEANRLLMMDCLTESDNYEATEDGRIIRVLNEANHVVIMGKGDLAYEHDGKTWWYELLEECSEDDIVLALDCAAINHNDLKGTKHEHLTNQEDED